MDLTATNRAILLLGKYPSLYKSVHIERNDIPEYKLLFDVIGACRNVIKFDIYSFAKISTNNADSELLKSLYRKAYWPEKTLTRELAEKEYIHAIEQIKSRLSGSNNERSSLLKIPM